MVDKLAFVQGFTAVVNALIAKTGTLRPCRDSFLSSRDDGKALREGVVLDSSKGIVRGVKHLLGHRGG